VQELIVRDVFVGDKVDSPAVGAIIAFSEDLSFYRQIAISAPAVVPP